MAPAPRAVVFDLDGTLIDSLPDIIACADSVLIPRGAPPLTRAEALSFVGDGAPTFVARLCADRRIGPEADVLAEYMALYLNAHDRTVVYDGVRAALSDLAAAGYALGLCTNKPGGPTRAVLDHLNLTSFFGTLLTLDSLPQRKPHPAPLLRAIADLGAVQAIFVGDSEVDAGTAHAAGVPFVLFSGGYAKGPQAAMSPADVFDHHDALPALVARLFARTDAA